MLFRSAEAGCPGPRAAGRSVAGRSHRCQRRRQFLPLTASRTLRDLRGRPSRPRLSPLPCDTRQRLQYDPVRQVRRDLGMVIRRGHLHHVEAGQRQFHGAAADGVEEFAGGEAARLGRAGTRRHTRVDDVDVDR